MLVILDKLNFYLHKFWMFLKPRRKLGLGSFVLLASFILVVWVVGTNVAHADFWDEIINGIINLIMTVAGWFIKLTFFILKFVIEVAGYNGFIDSPAVIVGWIMVRDVTNMFFVVVLLLISFGTILGLEQYEYKKLLVKLLMAAIIVNFSRIICGIIIDVAQVIMITFVNGIAATAAGNMVNMFGVDKIFSFNKNLTSLGVDEGGQFLAAVASITFAAIMMMTMLTFLFLLMARMLTLWILIVLSPFAFVLNVLPQTHKFAGQWWSEFGGNVVAGPIIAFFLWLSFVTVGAGNAHDHIRDESNISDQAKIDNGADDPNEESTGLSSIMTWAQMANFAIAIGMLLTGAKIAQQLGAAGGSMMGKAGEFGKKVAMIASGATAARWAGRGALAGAKGAGKLAAKGLYHGTNLVPVLHGIHPEQWKRRYENTKNKFWTWRQQKLNRKTTEATAISKMFRTNEKGEYAKAGGKGITEPKRYEKGHKKEGEIMTDAEGNIMYEDQVQSGAGDWITRQSARFLLGSMPGARGFMREYSADIAETRKSTEDQLAHLASTSQLPMGRAKLEAKQKLKELEETGAGIQSGKAARWEERRLEVFEKIKAKDIAGLREMGLDDGEIVDAENALKRYNKSTEGKAQAKGTKEYVAAEHGKHEAEAMAKYMEVKGGVQEQKAAEAKAQTQQIEGKLTAEKTVKELEAIRSLLETDVGKKRGEEATTVKAVVEQLTFDYEQAKALQLAAARDKVLESQGRHAEANNYDNTNNAQIEERIKKHVGSGDYVQSVAKTEAQIRRIKGQKAALAKAEETKDEAEIAKQRGVLKVMERGLSEMQMSNLGVHAANGDGNKAKILQAVGQSVEQNMDLTAEAITQLQAQDLAELVNEKVEASKAGLEKALERLVEMYGDKASAVLEQKRIRNERAAGQGSLGRAGLYTLKDRGDGKLETVLTDGRSESGRAYVNDRRTAGMSGSKITSVIGFSGSVDRDSQGRANISSEQSKEILVRLAAGITANQLGSVDEFVKGDLAAVLDNSAMSDLQDLLGRLKTTVGDKRGLAGLLKFVLEKNRMKDADKMKEIERLIEELNKPPAKSPKK